MAGKIRVPDGRRLEMKRFMAVAGMAVLLACGAAAPAGAYTQSSFTTGKDWTERMSVEEKLISIVAPMLLFEKFGVQPRLQLDQYVDTIDRVLDFNPQLGGEDVANIFASTLYHYEPENRQALDVMEMELRYRRSDYGDGYSPNVSLRPDRSTFLSLTD
jgi:hypothetical protein